VNPLALGIALLQAVAAQPAATVASYPFAVGERLSYSAKLGIITLGSGSLEVAAVDTLRGVESFHLRFRLEGKTIFYSLDDILESWVGIADFTSRRFRQDFTEQDKRRFRQFDIYPDSGYSRELGRDTTLAAPSAPLDDAAFFYFVRITPLEVGREYVYQRYFRKEKNPVTIEVLKRETMELPGGSKVPCLVLHPVLNVDGKGLFSKRSDTRIWLTDDARRLPVQIRAKFPFGTITLRLKEMIVPPSAASAPSSPVPGR